MKKCISLESYDISLFYVFKEKFSVKYKNHFSNEKAFNTYKKKCNFMLEFLNYLKNLYKNIYIKELIQVLIKFLIILKSLNLEITSPVDLFLKYKYGSKIICLKVTLVIS